MANVIEINTSNVKRRNKKEALSTAKDDINAFALTDEGYKLLQENQGKIITVVLCEGCSSQYSKETGYVQINIRGAGLQQAVGTNAFVHMIGLRLMSHELTHAIKGHRQSQESEMEAVRTSNIIMKQHSLMPGGMKSVGIQNRYAIGLTILPFGGISLEKR